MRSAVDRRRRDYSQPTAQQYALFAAHQHLIGWVLQRLRSWRARRAGCQLEDLRQAAAIGLWRATWTWDPRRGAFSTVACKRMRGEVLDCLDLARYGRVKRRRSLIDQSQFAHYSEQNRQYDKPTD